MIIGLYSPVPRSGKTTVCQMFQKEGFVKLSLAEPVKRTLHTMLLESGVMDANEYLWGDLKGEVIPGLKITGGYLMSTFATDYIRDKIDARFWLDILLAKAARYKEVIVDDLRFPNEFNSFDICIKIVRDNANKEHGRSQKSEGQLNYYNFDFTIYNTGTLEDLEQQVQSIIEQIRIFKYVSRR